jgi:hypothetical protein
MNNIMHLDSYCLTSIRPGCEKINEISLTGWRIGNCFKPSLTVRALLTSVRQYFNLGKGAGKSEDELLDFLYLAYGSKMSG